MPKIWHFAITNVSQKVRFLVEQHSLHFLATPKQADYPLTTSKYHQLLYMGCVLASEQSAFDSIAHTGELQAMLEELERLTLRYDDVRKLYEVFSFFLAADGHDSTISLTTLLLRMGIPYTAFTHEVFTIFSPGKLDFRALALSVWNYCTLTIENMRKYSESNCDSHFN